MSEPVIGAAYTFKVGLPDRANPGSFKVNPTLAAGDFKISINGGALANLTDLPTLEPAGSAIVKITLTAAEMASADPIVIASDAAGDEWGDLLIPIDTRPTLAAISAGVTIASGGIGAGAHSAAELNAIADGVLDRNMATGTDSGADNTTTRTVRQALRILRNKRSVAAGTLTVTKENDTTASWTAAVGTAAGNPTTSVDPT